MESQPISQALNRMSEISKNNHATNRLIDDWMLRALEAYQDEGAERQCLETLLLWWLGFGDRIDDDAAIPPHASQISGESVQSLRTQQLIQAALRYSPESIISRDDSESPETP